MKIVPPNSLQGIISFFVFLSLCVPCEAEISITDVSKTAHPFSQAHELNSNQNADYHTTTGDEHTLKQQIIEKTPVDKLNDVANDIAREMENNPYYKLPEIDRKIRELAILHPDVMENLGVYVVPIKQVAEETKSDSNSTDNTPNEEQKTTEDATQSHIDDLLQKTEMIKAMEPEEKLKYIPQLKHTIVYEILKNRDVLKRLSDKMGKEDAL